MSRQQLRGMKQPRKLPRCPITIDGRHIWRRRAWFHWKREGGIEIRLGKQGFICDECEAVVKEVLER